MKRLGVRQKALAGVDAEVDAFVAAPGIDDPLLVDLTDLPFVTIDNESSRDLDQAIAIRRDGDGFVLDYALADASYAVRPGTALFDEALMRGATFYLPGFAIPMLPRALSEHLVSLNPDVERRSLVMRMHLDARAEPTRTELFRARILSRAKLSYAGVEAWFDGEHHRYDDTPYTETLELMKVVGLLRIEDQRSRDVVQHFRRSTEVSLDEEGDLCIVQGVRRMVDRYNEQISLLCNIEGARFLRRRANPNLQPVFKVHAHPPATRVTALERIIQGIVKAHGLDDSWIWRPRAQHTDGETLAGYLARIPLDGPNGPVGQAIHRQSIWINRRSEFADEAAPHFGIGAEEYARFSAPMREIVGIFTHKEALEALADERPENVRADEALQAQVVEVSNRAKATQSRINKEVERLALDRVLEADLQNGRPKRRGIVMGLARSKVYVDLEAPPLEIKLYADDLVDECGGRPELAEDGATLVGPKRTFRIGDVLELRVQSAERGRWSFEV